MPGVAESAAKEEARTVTSTNHRRVSAKGGRHACLFLLLRRDRPLRPGARISLLGAHVVALGRGTRLAVARSETDGVAQLGLEFPDPHASSRHARLQQALGQWVVEDLGSKNGTFVDGRRASGEPLADGSILELGGTFFLFREAVPGNNADCLDLSALQAPHPGLSTVSPAFSAEVARVRLVAPSNMPMLLLGETGTGKELMARAIHALSGRPGPFAAVNCGAIPNNLVESELFGHGKGAFTGAQEDSRGIVRSAEGGTLLLDEIGDLPLPAQAALLRTLQEDEVMPVGASRPVKVDVRFVAATHRNLEELAKGERFRADLLARLSGHVCALPPLRERREDLALLVPSLLSRANAPDIGFSADAARALLRHEWPLNIRELEKCLAAAALLAAGGEIDLEHLPVSLRAPKAARPPPAPEPAPADRALHEELVRLLEEHRGNVTHVAAAMGKARTQVQRWLRRLNIDPLSFRR